MDANKVIPINAQQNIYELMHCNVAVKTEL